MKIYVNFEKPETVGQFLLKFFVHHTTAPDHLYGTNTFNDPECTIQQCPINKLRSFDDIFDCVQTYFSEITPKELMHELLILHLSSDPIKNKYLGMGTCTGIMRIRTHYHSNRLNKWPSSDKYHSKYSWHELLAMLDIYKEEQLEAYLTKYQKENEQVCE